MDHIIRATVDMICNGLKGIAVDIDGTIVDTKAHVMYRLMERFGNPYGYSTEYMVTHHGYGDTPVPDYWPSSEVRKYMTEMFFDNEFQKTIPPMIGVESNISFINEIIPVACYLSVRPESVSEGTQICLDKMNMPKAHLICRPSTVSFADGEKWKATILHQTYPVLQGIIDDNYKLIDALSEKYHGTLFLFGYQQKEAQSLLGQRHVIHCQEWFDVARVIKKSIVR